MAFKYLRCIYIDLGFQISRNYLLNDLSLFLKFDQMYKSWNSCVNSSFFPYPLKSIKTSNGEV